MSVVMKIKKGDSRSWVFNLDNNAGSDLSLVGATVAFKLTKREGNTQTYFSRDTSTQSSDLIEVTSDSTGEVTIRPTASDWTDISDYGIFIGEFKVTASDTTIQYTQDVEVHIEEAVV